MKKIIFFVITLILQHQNLFSTEPYVLWYYDLKSVSFGNSCSDDIDNDGKPEIVFSTYFNDETIYALNAEDGSLLWKYVTNGCNDAAPLILDVDNDKKKEVLLHSSSNQHFFCFNGIDGSIKWMVPSNSTDSPPSVADIDKDGKPEIIDGDFSGQLICYNAEDGSINWKVTVDTACTVQTEPVIEDVDGDGELDCVVATWRNDPPHKIAAYRLRDGHEIWSNFNAGGMIYHGPAIADIDKDNNMEVIIGCYDGILYCLNGVDGKIKWTFNFPDSGYIAAPTTIGDINGDGDYEIAFISGSRLGILNSAGKLLWDYDMTNWISAFRGVVFSDMNNDKYPDVVFGNSTGLLTALDGRDGSTILEFDVRNHYGKLFDINHGPIISDFNGDGLTDVFFVGGYTEYPAVEKSYGRAYMITVGKTNGPDWTMFRGNIKRNAVLPLIQTGISNNNIDKYNHNITVDYKVKNEEIHIQWNRDVLQIIILTIYDLSGKEILNKTFNSDENFNGFTLDVKNLASGAYIIRLTDLDSSSIKIFYKQ